MRTSKHLCFGLGLALLLAACTGKQAPTSSAAKRSATPPPALVAASTLTGKVKIIASDGGSIISDNGGGIISDNGGGIISDNGGGIISNNSGAIIANNGGSIVANNGGSLVSNNGGGLTSKVKRQVLAASGLAEYALADADVTFLDAAGQPALDERGKPLTAHTDAQGSYKLTSKLPLRNLVARVKVHDGGVLHGGELNAMCAKGAAGLQIDTATTLGAAYVLGKYVHGDQATFDKLPGAEADQLHDELQGSRGYLLRAPSYLPDQMVAITEALRGKVPAVDKRLDEIKALLLGQANLGQGRAASTVALAGPYGLAVGKDGTFYVGENFFGRIRAVAPDGKISNFADGTRGKIKANYPDLFCLAMGGDGSLYVTSTGHVFKIGADGQQRSIAGDGGQLNPRGVAVAPDGTVYFGEDHVEDSVTKPKLFAIPPGGSPTEIPVDDGWHGGSISSIAIYPNGDLAFTYVNVTGTSPNNLYRYHMKEGRLEALIPGISFRKDPDGLTIAPDGTLYVTESNRIAKIDPAGQVSVVAGDGAAPGLTEIGIPADLAIAPDGGLLFIDVVNALVREVTPDGKLAIRAGTTSAVQGDGFDSLALNVPQGAAFDDQGRVVVVESAAQRVVRFDGKTLEKLAGGERGFAGDGGPAKDGQFNGPQLVATDGPDIYVMDVYNHRLRHLDGAGMINTVAGTYEGVGEMTIGERRKADKVPIDPTGLAVDHEHRPMWATRHGQIERLAADGMVEWVAGVVGQGTAGLGDLANLIGGSGDLPVDQVRFIIPRGLRAGPDGAIYVAEFGGFRIARIADGKVTTYAGVPRAAAIAALGDTSRVEEGLKATAAALAFPADICFDKAGNLYVTEVGTTGLSLFTALGGEGVSLGDALPPAPPRVRRIAPDGTITTICGPGGKFFKDPNAEDAMVLPTGLSIAPDGRMVIVDTGANQIIILPAGSY